MFARWADGIPGGRDSASRGVEARLGPGITGRRATSSTKGHCTCESACPCFLQGRGHTGSGCPCLTVTMAQACPGPEDQSLDLMLT